MTYNGSGSSFWAAVPSGIYDVTNAGNVGPLGIACTNAYFDYVNFQNAGGRYIVAVNGVDKLKLYDGTLWKNIDDVSSPSITGVVTNDLSAVTVFKRRLWFAKKNSLDAYYLGIDAIGGALQLFPLGALFKRGGSLLRLDTWTIDGGNGIEDYLVLITTTGECAIYEGYDPTSADNFSLVGVFDLGSPVGQRCTTKFGGDLIYLGRHGVIPLSSILQSATIGRTEALSMKVQKAFSDAATVYGFQPNWQVINFYDENMLLVNVPAAGGQTQFVMNTITKAWTSFSGWHSNCFAVWNNRLYFGGNGVVRQAWIGTSDAGVAITGVVQQAYNNFNRAGNKQIDLTRLNVATSSSVNIQARYFSDFEETLDYSEVNLVSSGSTSLWDTGVWDSAIWGGDLSQLRTFWISINNKPAYFQSLVLRVQSASATFAWTSTDFAFQRGGIL
jgi:hypothetical protein